jgi:hypothetical protein
MWYMRDGAPAHFSRAVRDDLSNSYHDGWTCRGGPTAWPPRLPDLNPTNFNLWGHLKTLCMQLLLTTKRQFTVALCMPVKLSTTAPASSDRWGGPRWHVSCRALNLMEGILTLVTNARSRDGVVDIATGHGLDCQGVAVRVPVGPLFLSFPLRPDWFWGSPSLIFNVYQGLFPGCKAAEEWIWPFSSN